MKKLLIGVFLGILASGVTSYLVIPGMKQDSYEKGYNEGYQKGIDTGINAGIVRGIAVSEAEQKHIHDSLIAVAEMQAAVKQKMLKHKKVVKPIQNWHVIDGKIADPIRDR